VSRPEAIQSDVEDARFTAILFRFRSTNSQELELPSDAACYMLETIRWICGAEVPEYSPDSNPCRYVEVY
jgi:hypothetical protein